MLYFESYEGAIKVETVQSILLHYKYCIAYFWFIRKALRTSCLFENKNLLSLTILTSIRLWVWPCPYISASIGWHNTHSAGTISVLVSQDRIKLLTILSSFKISSFTWVIPSLLSCVILICSNLSTSECKHTHFRQCCSCSIHRWHPYSLLSNQIRKLLQRKCLSRQLPIQLYFFIDELDLLQGHFILEASRLKLSDYCICM